MPVQLSLTLEAPECVVSKSENGSSYALSFTKDDQTVTVNLSSFALDALNRQIAEQLPNVQLTQGPSETADDSLRQAAWPLRDLIDEDWQLVLHEVSLESLRYVLWFMKDQDLARMVLRNMSKRSAEELMTDLTTNFHGRDPDACTANEARSIRKVLSHTLDIVSRLRDEEQIIGRS